MARHEKKHRREGFLHEVRERMPKKTLGKVALWSGVVLVVLFVVGKMNGG